MRAYLLVAAVVAGVIGSGVAVAADGLEAEFLKPPESARPWAYWWWLDGYATKEGITRDLEEMKRQGIAGVLVFDAGEGGPDAPKGPVFMGEAWRELFKHAVREADRLGIEVGVNICSGWNAGGTWVTPEHAAKTLVWSYAEVKGPGKVTQALPRPKVWEQDYYRDIAVVAWPGAGRPAGAAPLKHFDYKAARTWLTTRPAALDEEDRGTPGERDCESKQVVDITDRMDATGRLAWDAPEGTWTVLRLGYTLLGSQTKCVSPGSKGLEIDFFSPAAFDFHWSHTGEKMIADVGPLAGKTLKYIHDDSYEVEGPNHLQQNWTPKFREEFRQRRGYDLLPYFAVLTGRIVDSRAVSNRFLWDYRRTIADLYAAGHYQRMSEQARRHKMGTHPESGGPFWPCIDALELTGINDIPMGEFWKRVPEKPDGKIWWADNYPICDTIRQIASAAHIYGKPVCQAEAYTSMGPNWEEDFFDMKDLGDRAFCDGLTRNMLCFYVHQGKLNDLPGYQWEGAGTHFDRNVTWWPQIHAWLMYLSRCQHLLKQGRFVADLCYYTGEDAPSYVPGKAFMDPPLPKGYDADTINTDVLLNRLAVKDGRLVLPDGMSYRLLVMPEQKRTMTPRVAERVRQLVEAGATIVARPPKRSPSLRDYPQCDEVVQRIAKELWGDLDGRQGKERTFGRGRVVWGKPLADVLGGDKVPPDFQYEGDAQLDCIHRGSEGQEIYFVSNPQNRIVQVDCVFRVDGKQPEIWDAVTGEHWAALNFRTQQGRTTVPLTFAPRQSWFIIFRKPAGTPDPSKPNLPALEHAGTLTGGWMVRFDPKWGGLASVMFETLEDWTRRPEPGVKYYSGRAVYEKTFDLPKGSRERGRRVYLDLGRFENVADVRLNGKDLGVVWTAPWRIEITGAVQPAGNRLEIGITNLWPNRLVGDANLPPAQRLTRTNVKKFKKDSPLLESGLIGPVTIQMTQGSDQEK